MTAPHYSNSQNSKLSFDCSWSLAKNLSNFVSFPWKLHNWYCHNVHIAGPFWNWLGKNPKFVHRSVRKFDLMNMFWMAILHKIIFFYFFCIHTYTVLHMFRQVLFWAENQGNHQNFEKSLLSCKCGLIFIGMEQKKKFFLKKNQIQNGQQKKWAFFWSAIFFCFLLMKTSQSL